MELYYTTNGDAFSNSDHCSTPNFDLYAFAHTTSYATPARLDTGPRHNAIAARNQCCAYTDTNCLPIARCGQNIHLMQPNIACHFNFAHKDGAGNAECFTLTIPNRCSSRGRNRQFWRQK